MTDSAIWKKYLALGIGILGIYLFVFCLPQFIYKNKYGGELMRFAKENEIDSGALFYTESEEGLEASFNLQSYNE